MTEIAEFAQIREQFMVRVQEAVYCSMSTVDRRGRPRSRVLHPVWDGSTGWVITAPMSHKRKHLALNPFVSLAYVRKPHRPVFIDCRADWIEAESEKHRIWALHRDTPPPIGFDPKPHYGTIENPLFGLLRFTPWRLEIAELGKESLIWRQALPVKTTIR